MSVRSPETNILIGHLEDCHLQHKIATYAEMAALLHVDQEGFKRLYRHKLTSALRFVFEVKKMVFQLEKNVGYMPIKADDVPLLALEESDVKLARINQKLKARLETVDPEKLSNDAKATYQVAASKTMMQGAIASSGFNDKLKTEVKKISYQDHQTGRFGLDVPIERLLKLFQN